MGRGTTPTWTPRRCCRLYLPGRTERLPVLLGHLRPRREL